MQLSNITLRLGGSQLHTVPKTGVTPAEILVLQRIHGNDSVVDVRPVKFDKNRSHMNEFERLANLYDGAASAAAPGDDAGSIMGTLFPGAMKKLPRTLKEIGMGGMVAPAAEEAEPEPETEVGAEVEQDDPDDEAEVDPFTPPVEDKA